MNKWTVALTGTLLLAASAHAEQWPQPESAYHATEPRAQWLETTPRPAPQAQPAWNQRWPAYGRPAAPAWGWGYGPWHGPDSWRPPQWRAPARHGSWPSWDSFSMPSPSFSSPSFSFPAPFGW